MPFRHREVRSDLFAGNRKFIDCFDPRNDGRTIFIHVCLTDHNFIFDKLMSVSNFQKTSFAILNVSRIIMLEEIMEAPVKEAPIRKETSTRKEFPTRDEFFIGKEFSLSDEAFIKKEFAIRDEAPVVKVVPVKLTAPIKKVSTGKTRIQVIIMLIGIMFIAANLRAPITSVGPVITEIAGGMNLNHVFVGLLVAIPLMSFAFLSAFAPKVARKIGLERLLLYSLLMLAFGLFIRSTGNVFFLFTGAALIGAAITVGNVLMPAFIKREFPAQIGIVTGVYLVSMNLTSALAAGYSIRIGEASGLGWQGAIGIWAVLAILGAAVWLPQVRRKPVSSVEGEFNSKIGLWKSRLAWNIAIFMGLQSLLFYCLAAWLPSILQTWGMSADRSGWMLSYIQMAQLPIMLIGPILAGRMKDQTPLVWITFILLLIGLGGVVFGKTSYIIISAIFIGVSLGLAFTLATMFFVLRTKQTSESAELSGMSQTVGYIIAAGGPPLFGALFSLTKSWYVPLGMLVVAAVVLFIVGLASAKDRFVTS